MSPISSEDNKRLTKNTLMLYFRMIVVTLLSLLTVKYTLRFLGEDDFGIYNVVGGVVAFLTVVNSMLTSATQRFLAFELGRKDFQAYNHVFNMLLMIFIGISVILFVVFESFGHIIIYNWLQIPENRLEAAYFVYHISVLTFISNFLVIPFSSGIIANERMGVYAYITIADALSKLTILAILFFSPFDKLYSYTVGLFLTTIFTNFIYIIYNQRYICLTRIYVYWDKEKFSTFFSYISWSIFGALSGVLCNQGLTILMNLFFGVTVNAAKAISDKIKTIVYSFVNNYYLAVSPQVIKSYAAGELERTISLAFRSTRLSYYLLFVISVPLMLMLEDILYWWLGDDSSHDMVLFTQFSLIFALVNVFEAPITFMIRATGQLKEYQMVVGIITLLVVPVAYILFKLGLPAYMAFVAESIVYSIAQVARICVVKKYFEFSYKRYFVEVVAMPLVITLMTIILVLFLSLCEMKMITTTFFATSQTLFVIWFIGLKKNERKTVIKYISSRFDIFK